MATVELYHFWSSVASVRSRMALADQLARLDSLAVEVRRHADVADDHVGGGRRRTVDETVVVLRLADDLEAGLRAAITERGGRAFGACHTCRHFRRNQRSGAAPHHCALLDEPLSATDAVAICLEHSA